MSYTALYRKFRPNRFDDVKGQEHIVTTLQNQIKENRMSHAYLFCGTRGTGKTTIAKIFARAVNCQNPVNGSPCGECPSCKAILEGKSMNVIEIDAASNNGVDNIRTIIEEVSYSPVDGKYKVYIIDEVHMLSAGAFNALLKTLEEPPSYAIFILATTESHKIPITILSRCQRYDFRRISIDTITSRLVELTGIEGVQCQEKALRYIAKVADGSMRDALSLLDQCLAFNFGNELTYEKTLDVLGAVDNTVFDEFMDLLLAEDVIGLIDKLEKIVIAGRELGQFITDFIWYLRNLMLIKSAGGSTVSEVLEITDERLAIMEAYAGKLELNTIMRYIAVFSDLSGRMKDAAQKRILVEMTLIKLLRPQMETGSEAVLERIRVIEEKLESGNFTAPTESSKPAAPGTHNHISEEEKKALAAAVPEDIQKIVREWPRIVGMTDLLLKTVLAKAKLSLLGESTLLILLGNKVDEGTLKSPDRLDALGNILNDYVGRKVDFEVRYSGDGVTAGELDIYADLRTLLGGIEIEEE